MALTPATGAPVTLLAPTEPAPTAVTLAWTSAEHTAAVITWTETGDVRNRIDLVNADGSPTSVASLFAEAGQPNRVPMFAGLSEASYRVVVRVVDAAGAELSDPASSPEFDTDRDPAAVITSVVPREDGSILMTWQPGTYTDPNPGDPLDDPPGTPFRYVPVASVFDFNDYEALAEPTTATSFVVPARQSPVNVGLRNAPNGWYGYNGVAASVDGNRLTAKVPSSATTGGKLTVTGKAVKLRRICDPGPCWLGEGPDQGRELRLQTRASASAPWRTVATTKAAKDGTYTLKAAFTGTAGYRVIAPAVVLAPDRNAQSFAATTTTTVRGSTGSGGGSGSGGQGGGGGLPITGAPVASIALAGILLVLLGGLLTMAGRRRAG